MHNQNDPYLYPDVPVLRNLLGIKDAELLTEAEVDITCHAIREITSSPIKGIYDFSHFCQFHNRIFGSVYDWAGSPRTVPIEKHEPALGTMSIEYSQPENIVFDAEAVLTKIAMEDWATLGPDELPKVLAEHMANLWKVHPFRDGNTRTTIIFFCQLIESKGIYVDRRLFEQNASYLRAALVAASAVYSDIDLRQSQYLVRIVKDSLYMN